MADYLHHRRVEPSGPTRRVRWSRWTAAASRRGCRLRARVRVFTILVGRKTRSRACTRWRVRVWRRIRIRRRRGFLDASMWTRWPGGSRPRGTNPHGRPVPAAGNPGIRTGAAESLSRGVAPDADEPADPRPVWPPKRGERIAWRRWATAEAFGKMVAAEAYAGTSSRPRGVRFWASPGRGPPRRVPATVSSSWAGRRVRARPRRRLAPHGRRRGRRAGDRGLAGAGAGGRAGPRHPRGRRPGGRGRARDARRPPRDLAAPPRGRRRRARRAVRALAFPEGTSTRSSTARRRRSARCAGTSSSTAASPATRCRSPATGSGAERTRAGARTRRSGIARWRRTRPPDLGRPAVSFRRGLLGRRGRPAGLAILGLDPGEDPVEPGHPEHGQHALSRSDELQASAARDRPVLGPDERGEAHRVDERHLAQVDRERLPGARVSVDRLLELRRRAQVDLAREADVQVGRVVGDPDPQVPGVHLDRPLPESGRRGCGECRAYASGAAASGVRGQDHRGVGRVGEQAGDVVRARARARRAG